MDLVASVVGLPAPVLVDVDELLLVEDASTAATFEDDLIALEVLNAALLNN